MRFSMFSGAVLSTFLLTALPALAAAGGNGTTVPQTGAARSVAGADAAARVQATRQAQAGLLLRRSQAGRAAQFVAAPAGNGEGFVSRGPGLSLAIDPAGVSLATRRLLHTPEPAREAADGGAGKLQPRLQAETRTARIEFVGANRNAPLSGVDPTGARVHSLLGSDPSRWQRNLPAYARVRAAGLYPGIDLVYYGSAQHAIEYDLVVSPHADPAQIRFEVSASRHPEIDADGNLLLDGAGGDMRLLRPMLYQDEKDGKKTIAGSFVKLGDHEFGFRLGEYDRDRTLVIDPQINLLYSTYAGGIHDDGGFDLAVDSSGATYLTGTSASQDFPVTSNAVQTVRQNIGTYTYDAVVMKFDASGNLLFSTFLGGSGSDGGQTMVLNPDGTLLVGGYTQSSDFPVTQNAYQKTAAGGQDAMLFKLSSDGSQLLYSTYLGGSGDDSISRMLLNTDGSLWIAGGASGTGMPVSAGAYQAKPNGVDNVFVAKISFDQNGSLQIPALTYLGGSNPNEEQPYADLALDSAGNVYVAGATYSGDFPVTANAYEKPFPLSGGCYNSPTPNSLVSLTKFSPDLKSLLYSTVLGGHTENQNGYPVCNQFARTIHIDAQGNIWIIGTTGMADFPVTANAISKQLNGNNLAGVDDFISELSADGSTLLYSTYFGGSQFDYGSRTAWDANNNMWIVSTSASTDYPVTAGAVQPAAGGGYDTVLSEISPDGTQILYGTYLGGSGDEDVSGHPQIRIDGQGAIRITGTTASANYPVTPNAIQPTLANGDQNPDGSDVYYAVLGAGTIGTLGPVVGGNTGDTSITMGGAGFAQGATCSLVSGGTVIASVQATVNSTGTSITCTFPLNGAATGSYDVVIHNPDGTSLTRSGGFSVQSGGAPSIWGEVVGRPKIRTGSPSLYHVVLGNSGSVDAYFVMAYLSFPSSLNFSFPFNPAIDARSMLPDPSTGLTSTLLAIPVLHAGQTISLPVEFTATADLATMPIYVQWRNPWFDSKSDATAALSAAVQNPAGLPTTCQPVAGKAYLDNCLGYWTDLGTRNVNAFLTTTSDSTTAQVQAQVVALWNSYLSSAGNSANQTSVIHRAPSGLGVQARLRPMDGNGSGNSGFFGGIFDPLGDFFGIPIPGDQRKQQPQQPETPPSPCPNGQMVRNCANPGSYVQCDINCGQIPVCQYFADSVTGASCTGTVSVGCQDVRNGKIYPKGTNSCPVGSVPSSVIRRNPLPAIAALRLRPMDGASCSTDPGPDNGGGGGSCGGSGGAVDPNYKAGQSGYDNTAHYIDGRAPIEYTVGFENEPTATLPAANVVVTDQLDPSKVDISTVTLGSINFGSTLVTLPAGVSTYSTTQKINSSLSVRIAGGIDQSGLMKWTFTTIDPSTGQPPSDPTLGFLPPDTDGIVGQGSVTFSVAPKSGSTGSQITNMASVVFDANAAIETPAWPNTLDVDPPSSQVAALPATQQSTGVAVSWSGTDKGSGIQSYDVYVSDNGGAFSLWQSATTATSATYTGTTGHTYGFYSQARDNVGNLEAAKSAADTSIGVGVSPDFAVSAQGPALTVKVGGSGSLTLTVTPSGGFSSAVSFACSGLPTGAACSFAPATVTPQNGAATTTLTITTAAPSEAMRRAGWGLLGAAAVSMLLLLRRRQLRLPVTMALLLLAGAGGGLAGCGGGGSSSGKPTNPGTPTGTSTVTVTATAGTLTHTTSVSLTVQ